MMQGDERKSFSQGGKDIFLSELSPDITLLILSYLDFSSKNKIIFYLNKSTRRYFQELARSSHYGHSLENILNHQISYRYALTMDGSTFALDRESRLFAWG